jgi:plastocyanin
MIGWTSPWPDEKESAPPRTMVLLRAAERLVRRLGLKTLLGVLILVAATESAEEPGTAIEGIVAIPERPAPPAPNPRYQVKTAGAIGPPEPPAAIVFVEAAGRPVGAGTRRAEMAQHHYQLEPGLLPIEKGTVVAFPNYDDEYHSLFSYSKPKRFDLGRYRKGEDPAELSFDQAGLVKLFCEIHDHMRGQILVLETPYFTKTTAEGRYRLEGLPAGHHVVKVWIDESTAWERPADLVAGKTLRVDFP